MPDPVIVPVLSCRAVSHGYRASSGFARPAAVQRVLIDCSFEIESGSCTALVGQSGSGKSTLTRIVLGLEQPSSGTVQLGGRDAFSMLRTERARWMAPVFQNPVGSLNPALTVKQNLLRPLRVHNFGSARLCDSRIGFVCERTGVDAQWLDARPAILSGGQLQRIALARALLLSPKLLVLDEPTASLDVSVQAMILGLLDELRKQDGISMLFVTHNLPVVAAIADRVLVLHRGRIVESGRTELVLTRPSHPHTQEILAGYTRLDRGPT